MKFSHTSFWSLDAIAESVWHAGAIRAAACEPGWRQQEQHNTIRAAGVCLPGPLQALQEECEVHYPGPTQQAPEDLAVLPASLCLSQSPPQDPQGNQSLLHDQGHLPACFGVFPTMTDSEHGAILDARASPLHDAGAEEICHDCSNPSIPSTFNVSLISSIRAPVPCRCCALLAMQHSTLEEALACIWCLELECVPLRHRLPVIRVVGFT